ncbi:MAG: hypothetical protein AB7G28_17460 [Pirellulales bacterium]
MANRVGRGDVIPRFALFQLLAKQKLSARQEFFNGIHGRKHSRPQITVEREGQAKNVQNRKARCADQQLVSVDDLIKWIFEKLTVHAIERSLERSKRNIGVRGRRLDSAVKLKRLSRSARHELRKEKLRYNSCRDLGYRVPITR